MDTAPHEDRLPPSLRLLKALVIILTLTMIGGVITIVALLVTRMPAPGPATPAALVLPDQIALPGGERAIAVTKGEGWFAIVTDDNRILIYNPDGSLRQDLRLSP